MATRAQIRAVGGVGLVSSAAVMPRCAASLFGWRCTTLCEASCLTRCSPEGELIESPDGKTIQGPRHVCTAQHKNCQPCVGVVRIAENPALQAWRASDRPGVPLGNRRDLGANAMVCKHFGDAVGFWHSPPRAHGKVQLAIAGRNRSGQPRKPVAAGALPDCAYCAGIRPGRATKPVTPNPLSANNVSLMGCLPGTAMCDGCRMKILRGLANGKLSRSDVAVAGPQADSESSCEGEGAAPVGSTTPAAPVAPQLAVPRTMAGKKRLLAENRESTGHLLVENPERLAVLFECAKAARRVDLNNTRRKRTRAIALRVRRRASRPRRKLDEEADLRLLARYRAVMAKAERGDYLALAMAMIASGELDPLGPACDQARTCSRRGPL